MATRDDPQFRIRLPVNLKKKLKESAQEAGRSLNKEIEVRLERSFSPAGIYKISLYDLYRKERKFHYLLDQYKRLSSHEEGNDLFITVKDELLDTYNDLSELRYNIKGFETKIEGRTKKFFDMGMSDFFSYLEKNKRGSA